MIKEYVKQWDENKHLLEEWFKNNIPSSYEEIHEKLFELVLKPIDGWSEWNLECKRVIDDGHYQGTILFVMCPNRYQPSFDDYVFTYVNYGSCSGCDTFESIMCDSREKQLPQLMELALHMVQCTKQLIDDDY